MKTPKKGKKGKGGGCKLLALVTLVLMAAPAFAVEVTQLVFTQTSSAVTATPNLRIMPMKPKLTNMNGPFAQGFAMDDSTTLNIYLTKSYTLPITSSAGALWMQTSNDVNVKKNSQTGYMTIYADTDKVLLLK